MLCLQYNAMTDLKSYFSYFLLQIMVSSGNDTGSRIAFNVDDPLATEAIFRLNGLENNGLKKVVRVAAYNSLGSGPFSEPGVAIVFDQFAGRVCKLII